MCKIDSSHSLSTWVRVQVRLKFRVYKVDEIYYIQHSHKGNEYGSQRNQEVHQASHQERHVQEHSYEQSQYFCNVQRTKGFLVLLPGKERLRPPRLQHVDEPVDDIQNQMKGVYEVEEIYYIIIVERLR